MKLRQTLLVFDLSTLLTVRRAEELSALLDVLAGETETVPHGGVARLAAGNPLNNRPMPDDYTNRRAVDEERLEWSKEWVWTGFPDHRILFQSHLGPT